MGTQYGMIQTDRDIPAFADMAMRGDLLLDKLVTKKFKVEEINDVAEAMKARQIKGAGSANGNTERRERRWNYTDRMMLLSQAEGHPA